MAAHRGTLTGGHAKLQLRLKQSLLLLRGPLPSIPLRGLRLGGAGSICRCHLPCCWGGQVLVDGHGVGGRTARHLREEREWPGSSGSAVAGGVGGYALAAASKHRVQAQPGSP